MNAQIISGNATNTSAFNNTEFAGAGAKTFANNASTTNVYIDSTATVTTQSEISVSGQYRNDGAFLVSKGASWVSRSAAAADPWSDVTVMIRS
jgi:hypothetical protein